jgi:mevalonate kinase
MNIVLFVANAGFAEAAYAVNVTSGRSEERLNRKAQMIIEQIMSSASNRKTEDEVRRMFEVRKKELEFILERDLAAIESCQDMLPKEERPRLERFMRNAKDGLVTKSKKVNESLDTLLSTYDDLVKWAS